MTVRFQRAVSKIQAKLSPILSEIKKNYIEEKAHYELAFSLPKGCYATNVLDVLRGSQA